MYSLAVVSTAWLSWNTLPPHSHNKYFILLNLPLDLAAGNLYNHH